MRMATDIGGVLRGVIAALAWLCLTLPALADPATSGGLGVQTSAGADLAQLGKLAAQHGSRIDRVVPTPDGGNLVTFSAPPDAAQQERLSTQLRRQSSVVIVEKIPCRKFYPTVATSAPAAILLTAAAPSVATFVNGGSQNWDPSPVNVSSSGDSTVYSSTGSQLSSTTREEFERHSATECFRTIVRGGSEILITSTPPPPTITDDGGMSCSDPTTLKKKDPEIKAKLVSGPLADFAYPRAIPLQIRARDYDTVEVGCDGCGGGRSNLRHAIQDKIGGYLWTLAGNGSLNDPFMDTENLEALKKQIEELRKEIQKLAEEIKALEDKKKELDDSRDARRRAIEEDIRKLEQRKAEAENEKKQLDGEIAQLESEIQTEEQNLEASRQQIKAYEDEIKLKQERIKELSDKIDGKPSPAEQALATRLEELQKRIEQKKAELEQKKASNQQREQALGQSYQQSLANLDSARQQLANKRAQVLALQNEIKALENSLFTNPNLRDFFSQRGRISQLGQQLKSGYFANSNLPISPTGDATSIANQLLQATSANQREGLLQQFLGEKDRLLKDLMSRCNSVPATDAGACRSGVDELKSEMDKLSDTLKNSVNNPLNSVDGNKWKELQAKRAQLADLEASIRAAEQNVQAAEQAADQAMHAYIDGLKELERSEAALVEEIRQLEAESLKLSSELRTLQEQAAIEREQNTPQWLKEIAAVRTEIHEIEGRITEERSKAEQTHHKILELKTRLEQKKSRREQLTDFIASLDNQIQRKRDELRELDGEADRLQQEIDAKKSTKEQKEQELIDLEKRLAALTVGTKQASGQQIYYYPPPLEKIIKDQARFDTLKGNVGKAEADYESARGFKAALQDRAFKILKDMNEQLWAVKQAKSQIASLEEEIGKLEREQAERKTELKRDQNEALRKEQEKKAELEQKKQDIDRKLEHAKSEEEREQGDVDVAKAAVDSDEQAVEQAEQDVFAKIEQLRIQRQQRQRKTEVLEQKKTTHDQTIADMRSKEAELARIEDAIARAVSADNEAGAANLRQAATLAERELKRVRDKVTQEQAELAAASNDLKLAVVAEKQAEDEEKAAQEALLKAQRELRKSRQELRRQTEELEEFTEKRLDAERKAKQAEQDVKDQEQKIQDTSDKANSDINDNEEVKGQQKAIDDKKQAKEDAENALNKAKNALSRLQEAKAQWDNDKQKAKDDVAATFDAMQAAKKALQDFLAQEFRNPTRINDTITLVVRDGPWDQQWRTDDDPKTYTINISYRPGGVAVIQGAPDDDLSAPADVTTPSICNPILAFEKEAPIDDKPIAGARKELHNIALYYREGEPLYDLWGPQRPVPHTQGTLPILSMAATEWNAGGPTDMDRVKIQCVPGGGGGGSGTAISVGNFGGTSTSTGTGTGVGSTTSAASQLISETSEATPMACSASKDSVDTIEDHIAYNWLKGPPYTDKSEPSFFIKTPLVPKDKCNVKAEVEIQYSDSGLQAVDEPRSRKSPYDIEAGVVGDVTKVASEFDPENKVKLVIQLFDGAHKGLAQEEIEWKVGTITPDIPADKYGIDADHKKLKVTTTDGSGYSKVDFYLDERYGKGTVTVKWKRGGTECESETIQIERKLEHRELFKGFAPGGGWDKAEKLFTNPSQDVEKLAESLPDEGADKAPTLATGLLDDQKDPVDEMKIKFSVVKPNGPSMDPEEMATKVYGFAWSHAKDVEEDTEELKLKAEVEEKLKPVTDNPDIEADLSSKGAKRFLIGREGAYLTIEVTDGDIKPGGDAYTGGAKLVIEGDAGNIPVEFKSLELQAEGIRLKEDGESPIAIEGSVSWAAAGEGDALGFSKVGYTFKLLKIGLTAGADGLIEGKVTVPTTSELASFKAIIGPAGFYGDVSDFPEMELAGLKLEKGASVVVDMHKDKDPDDEPEGWLQQGVMIRTASILLPESLKGNNDTPPKIAVSKLVINASGVSGTASLEYPIKANIGKLAFAINKVSLKLVNNQPTGTELEGEMTFPDPFVGAVQAKLTMGLGNQYGVEISTSDPVAAPSLGLAFTIQKMSGQYANEVFSFELSAFVKSENFSEINIHAFKFNSKGEVEAEKIEINKDIQIGKGFNAHLKDLGFKKTAEEFNLDLTAKFQFGEILEAEEVGLKIVTGPRIEEFDLKVKGQRKPVKFESSIHYKASLFEGSLKVDVEKLFQIDGTFVMGTQKDVTLEEFSFWYIELLLQTSRGIPLGQSGMSLLGIGGGVGYNYDPPIGAANGAPRKTDAFSFKAAITLGNVPSGEVVTGRTTLVLVSDRFTINGKLWLLKREDSLFGEGQLSLYWSPDSKLDGYLRMLIALPDSSGKLLRFSGIVDFYYGADTWYVKSRELEGSLLERVIATGHLEVKPGKAHLDGELKYDLYKEVPVAVVTLKVQVNLKADGSLDIVVTETGASLNATAGFNGYWDVNLDTAVKEFDIVSGSVNARLTLVASGQTASIQGSVAVSWDTWVHSGGTSVDLGYSI